VDGVFQPHQLQGKLREYADMARKAASNGRMLEGFVIDGKCLEYALEPDNEKAFVDIAEVCKTVICCRVSPKQKGAVVQLIKRVKKAITLAIGDGANDCNMIQSADVGVGIRGLEGLQAFNVCDYGISQFRFIKILLLAHGRWCYRRIAILVCYMFYKNVVLVLPQYFLGFVSGFSGQKLYNDAMYQMFNLLHSGLPAILFGVLDQDVSKETSLQNPQLYKLGLQNSYLSFRVAAWWLLGGLWHAIVVFTIPYVTMSNGNLAHEDGKASDIWMVGSVVYFLVCIVVNVILLMESMYMNWAVVGAIIISLLGWFFEHGMLAGYFGTVITFELHGTIQRMFGSGMMFLVMLVSVIVALMVNVQAKGLRRALFPTVLHKVQDEVLSRKAWAESSDLS